MVVSRAKQFVQNIVSFDIDWLIEALKNDKNRANIQEIIFDSKLVYVLFLGKYKKMTTMKFFYEIKEYFLPQNPVRLFYLKPIPLHRNSFHRNN